MNYIDGLSLTTTLALIQKEKKKVNLISYWTQALILVSIFVSDLFCYYNIKFIDGSNFMGTASIFKQMD